MSLHEAVNGVRRWIAEYSFTDLTSAEWESEYPEWVEVWTAAEQFAKERPVESWSAAEMDDMLYAIARDNEMEGVVDVFEAVPPTLFAVATAALERGEFDARWQLADRLGNATTDRAQAADLLVQFLGDPDEYVRRRALLAMGKLRVENIEEHVDRAWGSGMEYQRIAALHVLAEVRSRDLAAYVQRATLDGRLSVLAAAERAAALANPDRGSSI